MTGEPAYRSGSGRRVLWAGRLTIQKRPDLLIGAARALPDVAFDVYGYAYNHHDKKYEKELAGFPMSVYAVPMTLLES